MSEHKDTDQNKQEQPTEQEAAIEDQLEEQQASAEEQETQGPQDDGALTLEDELIAKTQQVEELKDKHLRLMAEFENFKKRSIREKMDMMKNAARDTMSALLPVLDDFDRAHKAAEENDKGDLFAEGIGLVYKKLYSTLEQRGLKPMETDGEPFDPELHEALTEAPAPSEALKGKIIDTIEKGYWLNDKIIRHAKVVVGK